MKVPALVGPLDDERDVDTDDALTRVSGRLHAVAVRRSDARLRGLVFALRDELALHDYVERELGSLLAHDAARGCTSSSRPTAGPAATS